MKEETIEEEIEEEGRKIKGKPEVYQPTKEEVEDHYRTHIPFRSWCPCCVAGRKKADPHPKAKEDKE